MILGFPPKDEDACSDAIVAIHRAMSAHLNTLGLIAPAVEGRRLSVHDVEHSLCEAYKHMQGTTAAKGAFVPSDVKVVQVVKAEYDTANRMEISSEV